VHHSGSGWLARPYPVKDFHLLFSASFPGALGSGSSSTRDACPLHVGLPSDRCRLVATKTEVKGQGTKSLRDSPLRGGKSREAVASREESDGESTRSPRSTSLLLQRSTLDQAHQVDLRPVSDAAMARCWNDKMALTNSANQVA